MKRTNVDRGRVSFVVGFGAGDKKMKLGTNMKQKRHGITEMLENCNVAPSRIIVVHSRIIVVHSRLIVVGCFRLCVWQLWATLSNNKTKLETNTK